MFEIKGWYCPVKDTHAASIRPNQTICLPKWTSLLDRNCYAELAPEFIKRAANNHSWFSLHSIHQRGIYEDLPSFTTQWSLFHVDLWNSSTIFSHQLLLCSMYPTEFSPNLPFHTSSFFFLLIKTDAIPIPGYLFPTSWHASHAIRTHHESLPRAVLFPLSLPYFNPSHLCKTQQILTCFTTDLPL